MARTCADSDASTGMPVTAAVTPGLLQISDAVTLSLHAWAA